MRLSKLFFRTLREVPSEAETTSHQLLVRAGFIRQLGAGIFAYLNLAHRSMEKIKHIMREEIDAIGGQEITMPVAQPAEIWKKTERYYQIGAEMGRFTDRYARDMVLAMTHEEAMAFLANSELQSYKQLPALVYHIQTKWRDDPRPRAGLIRVREFTMKDSYSLDKDWEGLDQQYRAHYKAYFRIFNRCGLPAVAVKSDVGMMGGKIAHEYMYLSPIGEDTLVMCPDCGYIANRQVARFKKTEAVKEELMAIEKVATPNAKTIEELADFLNITKDKTAKAVFMIATILDGQEEREQLVFAVIRGDMDVNETKLANAVKAKALRPAMDEEISAVGAVTGYASPIDLKNVLIVVDDSIPEAANLVAGANEEGYHLRNVNYGRDYKAEIITDIAIAEEGAACPDCGKPMTTSRGIEVGNIFKLGTRYTDAMGCSFLDENGKRQPVIMGSYGIGVGRLLACVAEEHNDEYGLCWPITIAPYQVHLIAMKGGEEAAEKLYQDLQGIGVEVLFDDRNERPGVKFNDADLIGLPIRITASQKSVEAGGFEFKLRNEKDKSIVDSEEIISTVLESIQTLTDEINANVQDVEYTD
jgi:prolyl-tRNA synthetase